MSDGFSTSRPSLMPGSIPADAPMYRPNCGVVSVAMICGISHAQAWAELAAMQRGGGRGWRGRTHDSQRWAMLRKHGVTFEHILCAGMTLRMFLKSEHYRRSSTYEITITGHAMTLQRGQLFDQNGPARNGIPAMQSPHLRRKMKGALLITGGSPLVAPLDKFNGDDQ